MMTPEKFAESVRANLTDGRVFPPIGGKIGNLQIAAVIVATAAHEHRGTVLLANTDPCNDRVFRINGEVGKFALGSYNPNNSRTWNVEVGLLEATLRSLADPGTFDKLTSEAPEPPTITDDQIIRLNYYDPGVAPGNVPSINGVPFEDVVHY